MVPGFVARHVSGMEEDAHEFMEHALEELQKSFPVGEGNLIDKIFGGRLVHTVCIQFLFL